MLVADKKETLTGRIFEQRERVLSARPTVCTERAMFYTKVYTENENQPVIIKRALALEMTLKNMTIFIDDGELIAGNQSSKHRAAPVFPEYAVDWLPDEIDSLDKRPGDAFFITKEQKNELLNIAALWRGKVLNDKSRALMSEELRDMQDAAIIKATGNMTSGDAHIAVDFYKILQCGLDGYLTEINHYQKNIKLYEHEGVKKGHFYTALSISIRALQAFILRYSGMAASQAKNMADKVREKELELISSNCRHISSHPPYNFYQALQLVYFIQLVLQIESNGHSVSLGRMDQYLYPFYKKDIAKGLIDEECHSLFLTSYL